MLFYYADSFPSWGSRVQAPFTAQVDKYLKMNNI